MTRLQYFVLLSLALILGENRCIDGHMVGMNPYRRREVLDRENKFHLEWLVDWKKSRVIFSVTAETQGYVGFGLSSDGRLGDADVIIGGVTKKGRSYFGDYHVLGEQYLEQDESQDWILHQALENQTHTRLTFSRRFDTRDPLDYQITEDRITLIWTVGKRDNFLRGYRHREWGTFDVYLIHPDYTPWIQRHPVTGHPLRIGSDDQPIYLEEDVKLWTISSVFQVPSNSDTSYWCTVRVAPRLRQKHHVVGMDLRFPSEESRVSVHHIQISRCNVPRSQEGKSTREIFAPFLKNHGQLCYRLEAPTGPIPTDYCTHVVLGMAQGSRAFFLPFHVGIPFGFTPEEYYVLQVHYDNSQLRRGLTVQVNMDIYYTSKLRSNDGGFMAIGHAFPGTPPSILIPPYSRKHQIYGHCETTCTQTMLPPEGIRMVASITHSHISAKKMRLQHFRSLSQLPAVVGDENYSTLFQQTRVNNREVLVLPGDHLRVNCEYDNTWTNGSTVVGGFSTSQEMCLVFMYYYNKLNVSACVSEIVSEKGRHHFLAGVTNITWNESKLEYVASPPHALAGLTISEISDYHVSWDSERRRRLQIFHNEHPQVNYCMVDGY